MGGYLRAVFVYIPNYQRRNFPKIPDIELKWSHTNKLKTLPVPVWLSDDTRYLRYQSSVESSTSRSSSSETEDDVSEEYVSEENEFYDESYLTFIAVLKYDLKE